MDEKIDFVITWVDESDPKWRKEFDYYSIQAGRKVDATPERYRDWGTLRYWFRGVEQFAPWVNKIYFVTYGHLPRWLNTNHPKLVIVCHEDFIPKEYLPTFNSYCIEFHLHRIHQLSDHFVYFNDDMFLIDNIKPDRFFKNGLPCDVGGLSVITTQGFFGYAVYMALDLIRQNFNMKEAVSQNRSKWYSMEYPRLSLLNLLKFRQTIFPGFVNTHLPQAFLKETFEAVWSHCEEDIIRSCRQKFRDYGGVCFWLVRYWQLTSGNFTPYNIFKDGQLFPLMTNRRFNEAIDCIKYQKKKVICVNDGEYTHFEDYKDKLLSAFEEILPQSSSFEL